MCFLAADIAYFGFVCDFHVELEKPKEKQVKTFINPFLIKDKLLLWRILNSKRKTKQNGAELGSL